MQSPTSASTHSIPDAPRQCFSSEGPRFFVDQLAMTFFLINGNTMEYGNKKMTVSEISRFCVV